MNNKPIFVTAPSLAPISEFAQMLEGAWETGVLTHNGPLLQQLEKEFSAKFNIRNTTVVLNGTIALQMAVKALDLKGEIITTPFSWVATCSSIIWENCTPVFVDIDPNTLNIDPEKIEAAISYRTVGIMPVHVFSNPCDIEGIKTIADKYGLKVIYDAAHAVGVNYKGQSVLEYGDISATSFHATKIFNSGEGGACIANDELTERLKRLRFFGYNDQKEIVEDGMNGKMTEIHAALGLVNLKSFEEVVARRKAIFTSYKEHLEIYDGKVRFQTFDEASYNYSYMPIILDSEETLLEIDAALKEQNVFGRRYFYPSLNTVKAVAAYQPMPISEDIASRIFCLPSHQRLTDSQLEMITKIVLNTLNYA
jgi:dTDP-4-amino-4,6-dideoxygalactose transaminase